MFIERYRLFLLLRGKPLMEQQTANKLFIFSNIHPASISQLIPTFAAFKN